jgi:hypothetical protein
MIETDCGSIYGEAIYSAELYSWEVCWAPAVCAPVTRETAYVPPPTGNWQQLECVPLTER